MACTLEIDFKIQKFENSGKLQFLNSKMLLESLRHGESDMTLRFEFGHELTEIHCCKDSRCISKTLDFQNSKKVPNIDRLDEAIQNEHSNSNLISKFECNLNPNLPRFLQLLLPYLSFTDEPITTKKTKLCTLVFFGIRVAVF